MRVEHIPPRWKRELEPHQLNCYDGLPADVIEEGYVLDRSTRR